MGTPALLADAVALTRALVETDTVNPPGNESMACDLLEPLLRHIGFAIERLPFAPGRDSLVAFPAASQGELLAFTGHLDTVPLGLLPWVHPPFMGAVREGRLYGRGSSDMKAGIAAFLCAVAAFVADERVLPRVMLVLTAAEETGAEGARSLRSWRDRFPRPQALLVGEPTANRMMIGHKGALWLKAQATGRAAHGAMPEQGDNAIYKAVDAIQRIRTFKVEPGICELLGSSTLNVGTIEGGLNVNSVPDSAEFGVDIRTVGSIPHAAVVDHLQTYLGRHIRLRAQVDVPSLRSDPAHPWIRTVTEIVRSETGGTHHPSAVSFFTDGPALRDLWGDVPTAILGPGEPTCAHVVDEYCEIDKLNAAVRIYKKVIQSHQSH